MIRLIPDWLLYIVTIAVVVLLLFALDKRSNAPEALPDAPESSGFLPPPSVYDPEILVEVGPQSSGLGSAFAISPDGWWITARHVVDACSRVGIIHQGALVAVGSLDALRSRVVPGGSLEEVFLKVTQPDQQRAPGGLT